MVVYYSVVMIGDGATDLEACPPAVSVMSSTALFLVIQVKKLWQIGTQNRLGRDSSNIFTKGNSG